MIQTREPLASAHADFELLSIELYTLLFIKYIIILIENNTISNTLLIVLLITPDIILFFEDL